MPKILRTKGLIGFQGNRARMSSFPRLFPGPERPKAPDRAILPRSSHSSRRSPDNLHNALYPQRSARHRPNGSNRSMFWRDTNTQSETAPQSSLRLADRAEPNEIERYAVARFPLRVEIPFPARPPINAVEIERRELVFLMSIGPQPSENGGNRNGYAPFEP